MNKRKVSKDYGFGKLGDDEIEIIIDKNGMIQRAYCWREDKGGGPLFWEAEHFVDEFKWRVITYYKAKEKVG